MVCVRHLFIIVLFSFHGFVNNSRRLWSRCSRDGGLRYRALSYGCVVGFEVGYASLEVAKVLNACLERCQ
jgi:hypothetical protein